MVLTGGIASGKTAVADEFAALGVPVIDTDEIAREVVNPGTTTLQNIATAFGTNVLLQDGGLNRRKLREIIFADPVARKRLEALIHPEISRLVKDRISQIASPYCLLVIPLFVESTTFAWADRVLLVDVPENIQIERVMERDRIRLEEAEAILSAQATREQRKAAADDIIDNSGPRMDLTRQVKDLHDLYLTLSRR